MAGIRRDVASLGAGWNPTLEWYAKAIRKLQTRPLNDRTSWWYLGAIHGFDQARWVARGFIKATDALPPATDAGVWDQCQHQTWYFLPWHRGYLHAFEAIVAATIKDLGGPTDWALPYWNYFGPDSSAAVKIHTAFTARKMADGSPNPLKVPRTHTRLRRAKLNLNAMKDKQYTAALGVAAFGGSATGFSHFGGGLSGSLELNPHNVVHVRIGELMENPNTAALDPIFWLHHCNVDRLWAAWLSRAGNVRSTGMPSATDRPASSKCRGRTASFTRSLPATRSARELSSRRTTICKLERRSRPLQRPFKRSHRRRLPCPQNYHRNRRRRPL